MVRNRIRTIHSANRAANYLAAGGKKTVLAFGLVAIMAVMWFRVLTGGGPQSVAAKPPLDVQQLDGTLVQVRFRSLPVVPGRNDRIERNFFTVEDWNGFSRDANNETTSTDSEVHVATPDRIGEVIAQVAQRLKLKAVLWSENPQVFVNDTLLKVGETLSLKDGTDTYVFEVVRIEADTVFVRCRERELALKLAQSNDVNK